MSVSVCVYHVSLVSCFLFLVVVVVSEIFFLFFPFPFVGVIAGVEERESEPNSE